MKKSSAFRSSWATGTIVAVALSGVLVASDDLKIVNPPAANPDLAPAFNNIALNKIASNYSLELIAQGADPLENQTGVYQWLGFLNDAALTRTEPDENTYLVTEHDLGGPTPGYRYGRRYLFQGHENSGNRAYVTRINLDVDDPAHRVTLLTPPDALGNTGFNSIDGSTWDPFTRTMLFTQEAGTNGGVIEIPAEWTSTTPPASRRLDCVVGRGGFEGIHPDDAGALILVEDSGGQSVSINPADASATPKVAKQPNSFIYRFEPNRDDDLSQGGKLYALQVIVDGAPVIFGGTTAAAGFADTYSIAQLHLRDGHNWPAMWVLIHDTGAAFDFNHCSPFDANAAAKAAGATPLKRPENGQFLPGSKFATFFFDETGDTDARAGAVPELAARGAWGSIFRIDFPFHNHVGTLRIVARGDAAHASFDNLTFADGETLLAAEDRGDLLHDQLQTLDSVWAYDVVDFDVPVRRLIGLGRDPLASPTGAEDNEPTGVHVSDGSASIQHLVGTHKPAGDARWFMTQQHGLNMIFEIHRRGDHDHDHD